MYARAGTGVRVCCAARRIRYTDGEVVVFVFEAVAATDPFGGRAVGKSLVGECRSRIGRFVSFRTNIAAAVTATSGRYI